MFEEMYIISEPLHSILMQTLKCVCAMALRDSIQLQSMFEESGPKTVRSLPLTHVAHGVLRSH